jgi:hypothetical protein
MSENDRQDPLDQLRGADPAHLSPAPSESKARIWARIQEATMDHTRSTPRTRLAWAGGLAAAGIAGVVAIVLLLNPVNPATDPSNDPSDEPGTDIGRCVETYSAETLANRDFAFDGIVTAIEGDKATFAVDEVFQGDIGDSITLQASGMTGTSVTSVGGPSLARGERFLVAGDDEFVWACGFTQPYNEAVAAEWREATR